MRGTARLCGALHRSAGEGRGFLREGSRRFENELVVDLEEKADAGELRGERGVEGEHRLLDEVRGRALERRVHRHALGVRADVVVAVVEARNRADAPEDRLGAARRARFLEDRVEAGPDPREAVEVGRDELLRLRARDAELRREGERTHAVEDAEVDRLGAPPLIRRHGTGFDAENLRRCRAVDVLPAPKDVDQRLVAREVREDPELDLRVVRRDEAHAFRRDERAPDLAARFRPDRDVLEIRRVRGEPACRGDGLVVPRVHAPIGRDVCGQRVHVRALELGDLAPLENEGRHGAGRERLELLEDVGARRVRLRLRRLPDRRVAEPLEQHLAELKRRPDVERLPRRLVDLRLERREPAVELLRESREDAAVHGDAGLLHPRENGHERKFDFLEDP